MWWEKRVDVFWQGNAWNNENIILNWVVEIWKKSNIST